MILLIKKNKKLTFTNKLLIINFCYMKMLLPTFRMSFKHHHSITLQASSTVVHSLNSIN